MKTSHPVETASGELDIGYEAFIANAPFGVFVADEHGAYIFVNDAACKTTGYQRDELIGKNLIDLIYPDDRNAAFLHFSKVQTSGQSTGEIRYLTKSGDLRYWEVKATRISETRFIGFTSDITERRLAGIELLRKNEELQATLEELSSTEEELKQQLSEIRTAQQEIELRELKYRQLFNSSDVGIALHEIICDEDGIPVDYRFIEVNPAFEKMTGLHKVDITGKTVREVLPAIESVWIATYGQVALTGKTIHFENYSSDLGKYYQVTAYSPLKNQFATLVQDITERKLQEIHIQETNSFLESLITNANVPIIVWDPVFQISRINHAFELLIGKSADEVVGNSLEILFPPQQAERSMRLIRTTLEGVRWDTVEIQLVHQSGEIKTILWNSSTIFGQDGKTPLATIAQGRDVTLERLYEHEKDTAAIQIQENIAKLAILNDGIRNPLTIIGTYVDMAEDNQTAGLIQAEIRRIDEMVSSLDREWVKSDKILNFLKKHDFTKTGFDPTHSSEINKSNLNEKTGSDVHQVSRYELFIEELQAQLYTILDSIDALIYVADMETYEILYLNKQGRYSYGNVLGQKCYTFFQKDMNSPCSFCTNHLLIDEKGPTGVYRWEYFNQGNGRWYDCRDRAIRWTDGRLVRLEIATDITEKKRAEEEIKRSEERFKTLVNAIQETMSVISRDGTFIYANALAARNLSGKDPSYLIGKNIRDFVSAEKADELIQNYQRTIDTETPFIGEVSVEMQGSRRYFYNRLLPFRFSSHEETVVLSLSIDITEQHEIRASLARSEEQYRRIVDTAEEGIWQMDGQKKTTYVNHRMAELLGYTPEEMIGREVTFFMPPDEISQHAQRMNRRKKGENDRYEQQFVKKDGTRIWLDVSATALVNEDGTFNGSFAMFTDITEQKKTEEALRESENRFYELFNNMPTAVAIYIPTANGNDFIFKDFNRAAERFEQIKKEDIMGRSVREVFPGVTEFGLFDVFKRVYQTGMPEKYPISLYQDDRIAGWKENYVYRLPSGEIVAIYDDVTDQKQNELTLKRNEKEFRDIANSITDVFFAMDEDLHYTYWNHASEVLTGIPAEKALGKSIHDLFPGKDGERAAAVYKDVIKNKVGTTFVNTFTRDGEDLFFEKSVYPTERGISVFTKDITEQKRMQDALQESAKKGR